jgi:molybdenum cofactor synthesis domain-containing protein
MESGAAILIIGNEILSGKVRDANSPFLVDELRSLGVPVRRILVVPDVVDVIAGSIRSLSASFRHVFTSGGVGPTLDDLTFEGLSRAFDAPLEEEPRLAAVIRNHFGTATRASHLKMARLPRGATLRWTAGLLWPVVEMQNVMVFPGDPGILREKFTAVREDFRDAPFHLRRVFTTLDEGTLAPILEQVDASHPSVAVGSYPVYGNPDYAVQVTLESKDARAVERAVADLLAAVPARDVVRLD